MRSILVSLGPWEWPAVFGIAVVVWLAILGWRWLERALGEEPAPINRQWYIVTGLMVAVVSVGLLLLINRFAPVQIKSYGVMLLLGFVAGIIYANHVGPQRGLSLPFIIDMTLMDLLFAIVGARGIFVLTMYKEYAGDPKTVLDVWRGGLSFHGGLLGAVIATIIFCRWRRVRFAVLADICTPGVCLGYAITRIGCFLNGCCHGGPTTLPWGVRFPEIAHQFPMPVHPTQLYASAGSIGLYFIVTTVWKRMHRPGQLFPLYLVLYSILRFLLEYTRRGASAEVFAPIPALTVAQFACIFIAIGGLIWFLILQRWPAENPLTARAVREPEPAPAPAGKHSGKKKH
jgi:phosphatidylglycerol:prolipoprotein diacylglycerol transferase